MIRILLIAAIIAWAVANEIRSRRINFRSLFLLPAVLLAIALSQYFRGPGAPEFTSSIPIVVGICLTVFMGAWRGSTVHIWKDSAKTNRRRGTRLTLLAWILSITVQLGVGFMIYAYGDGIYLKHATEERLLLAGLSLGAQGLAIQYRSRHNQFKSNAKMMATRHIRVAMVIVAIFAGTLFLIVRPRSYPRAYLQTEAAKALAEVRPLGEIASERAFFVGAAIGGPQEANVWSDAHATVGHDFNSITPENALKWGRLLTNGMLGADDTGTYDFREADEIVDFGRARNVRVRGHNLVWGRFPGLGYPRDLERKLERSGDAKGELRKILSQHINDVLDHFHGRIGQWDVVNEPLHISSPTFDDNIFLKTLGPDYIAESFRIAHAADPAAILFLNEQLDDYGNEHAQKLLELVQDLVRAGVPIHGVGLQSHILLRKPNLAALAQFLQRLDTLGLQVEITELDVRVRLFSDSSDPYGSQGAFVGDLVRVCRNVSAFRGVTFWGIDDGHSWLDRFPPFQWMKPNDPLLLDADLRRKPIYAGLAAALH